jgi:diacylglycerol kinase family enzyme
VKNVALIVNPRASRVTPASARDVERALGSVAAVATRFTERPGHATELAAELRAYDAVVVFSGDGGYNEVLNGIDGGPPVGFVPGGGSNVLPRALGLPRDPRAAAARIGASLSAGRTRRISLGRANGRRFAFAAGVGLDAEIVRRVNARGRGAGGRRPRDAYFVWTLMRVLLEQRGRYDPRLEIRGVGRAAFALVANADPYTYFGSLPVHFVPHARFEGGLDIVAPVTVRAREFPVLVGAALAGRSNAAAPNIRYLHDVEAVEVVCDGPMPLHVDGEDLGDVAGVTFSAERDAVDVVA